ncbi:MAG TPA: SufE family protein [Thermoflexales bacterium]|nr:SufE family protein [Thermoflexales bacterium]
MDLAIYGWDAQWAAAFRPFADEGLTPARVAIEYNHLLRLYTTAGDVRAQHSGKLLHAAVGRHAMAAVGDWVAIRTNPGERTAMLIEYSDQFVSAPASVAAKPYPESARVPHCESETFVFMQPEPEDRLKFFYAVENPFGVSARSLCAIFDQTINGLPAQEIAAMPIEDIVPTLFGKTVLMGKGQGLLGIAAMMKARAQGFLKSKAAG